MVIPKKNRLTLAAYKGKKKAFYEQAIEILKPSKQDTLEHVIHLATRLTHGWIMKSHFDNVTCKEVEVKGKKIVQPHYFIYGNMNRVFIDPTTFVITEEQLLDFKEPNKSIPNQVDNQINLFGS